MDNNQKDEFNQQIRKILKKFGIQAHDLVKKRFEKDISNCEICLKLEIDAKQSKELKTTIKIF